MGVEHKSKGKLDAEGSHLKEASKHPKKNTASFMYNTKAHAHHMKNIIGKFTNVFNPNHRHDEAYEIDTDKRRTAIANSHRFHSYAPVRDGNKIKWYTDARDYLWAVSEALDNAKETIYIAGWWISPELFLRRPPLRNQKWRLDQVLKRRAEAGVQIYVIVYKEMAHTVTSNSGHTKRALKRLCPIGTPGHGNIHVLRHPDHMLFENAADRIFYWAHHEKFVVIDNALAFVGGIDLSFGRWDTHQHAMADVHSNMADDIFPGQDYNNNRILDFQTVQDWQTNALDKVEYPRMPWHDVSMGIIGDCVQDVAEHFVLRWNFVKRDKYKRNQRVDWILLEGQDEGLLTVQRPLYPCGDYIKHPFSPLSTKPRGNQGTVRAQLVRSSADWSSGILVERSIQNAYAEIIRGAEHFVYIENQYFVTATGDGQKPIHNVIGRAVVDACVRAGKEGRKFRVMIVIPAIPAFPGDLRASTAAGTRAIMDYQFRSINRGEHSIMAQIAAQGVDPTQHIFVFNLRAYDRINYPSEKVERAMRSGVRDATIQREAADSIMSGDANPEIHRHKHMRRNWTCRRLRRKIQRKRKSSRLKDSTAQFDEEKAGPAARGNDSVSQTAMLNGQMSQEYWKGDLENEKEHIVQEQLYVHGKVCIVDDRVVICGSANINDRSQLGNRDSELAIVMEDQDIIDSTMDGKPYKATRHAASLRRRLWKEHLGLLPPQQPTEQNEANPQTPEVSMNEEIEGPENNVVEDPIGDEAWKAWTERATVNTQVFRHLFHADPDDCIRTFEDYDRFRPKGTYKEGHIIDMKMPAEEVRRNLDQIKGHVVWMPLDFLKDAEMAEPGLSVNRITESMYT